jgi:hypothetical protein
VFHQFVLVLVLVLFLDYGRATYREPLIGFHLNLSSSSCSSSIIGRTSYRESLIGFHPNPERMQQISPGLPSAATLVDLG